MDKKQRQVEAQVASEIRRIIKVQGRTQVGLSRALKVGDKQVTTYLSGGRGLLTGTARRMLAALRVRVRLEPIPPTCGDCAFFNSKLHRCKHSSHGNKVVPTYQDTPGCPSWEMLE
ncbi:hypothetical protein [uncultured Meiothermus sp.]|jgi:hypothetical protein|uniref:hypothetical protein n=1 Tax=uncultured Meiothermus sp. TaxID=157471 RepID=UPI002614E55C|nr:hypothetical protein [uncultured Meiothermus sp.]